jgi:hypothetical protein
VLLDHPVGELGRAGVQTVRGGDPAGLDRISPGGAEGDEAVLAVDLGDLEAPHPPDRVQGGVPGSSERLGQGGDLLRCRGTVEAADPDIDRVDGATPDHLHDQVAGPFDAESPLDRRPVELGQLDRVGAAEEVGCVEQVDVEGMALDPLAAVQEAAQGGDPVVDTDPVRVLHGQTSAHLVGHRADPADPRRDIGCLGGPSAPEHRLEVPWRLEDGEGDVLDDTVTHVDPEGPLPLDPGQAVDRDGAVRSRSVGHGCPSRSGGVGSPDRANATASSPNNGLPT